MKHTSIAIFYPMKILQRRNIFRNGWVGYNCLYHVSSAMLNRITTGRYAFRNDSVYTTAST